MGSSEGTMVCERPIPHRHKFPKRRNDGQEPVHGDIAQCVCGQYAVSHYGEYWLRISTRRALRKMRRAGCINGGRSE
jgi:hypothetical protein